MNLQELHSHLYLIPIRNDKGNEKAPTLSSSNWIGRKIPEKKFFTGRFGARTGEGNLEVLDIDNHFGDAKEWYDLILDHFDLTAYPHVATPSGGYHIYYKVDEVLPSKKLAWKWDGVKKDSKGKPMPEAFYETRGLKALVVCPPTEGYNLINGDLCNIPTLSIEDRDFIWEVCTSCDDYVDESRIIGVVRPSKNDDDYIGEPAGTQFINDSTSIDTIANLLSAHGWKKNGQYNWTRPGKDRGVSATLGRKFFRNSGPVFRVYTSSNFIKQGSYTLFGAYAELEHNGNYQDAAKKLGEKYKREKRPIVPEAPISSDKNDDGLDPLRSIIRVGTTYFKRIKKNGTTDLKPWKREAIVDDFGKDAIKSIKRYDDFDTHPSHTNYKQIIDGHLYNLYEPPIIMPAKTDIGKFETIDGFFGHLFGDRKEIGLDWMQISYCNPLQRLPILCFVSKENETGKSTFSHLMTSIFGANFCSIGQTEFKSEFNSSYVGKNIVCIDEGEMEQKQVEMLKNNSTDPFIHLRRMHIDRVRIKNFSKYIILSNKVDSFITANKEDNRFWIQTVPKAKSFDPHFLDKMKAEVPAFLHFLINRKLHVEKSEGRFWIGQHRYLGEEFKAIVRNSRDPMITMLFEKMLDDLNRLDPVFDEVYSINGNMSKFLEWYLPTHRNINTRDIKLGIEKEWGLAMKKGRYNRYTPRLLNDETKHNGNYFTISKEMLEEALGYK